MLIDNTRGKRLDDQIVVGEVPAQSRVETNLKTGTIIDATVIASASEGDNDDTGELAREVAAQQPVTVPGEHGDIPHRIVDAETGEPPAPGRNGECKFKGEKRSNETGRLDDRCPAVPQGRREALCGPTAEDRLETAWTAADVGASRTTEMGRHHEAGRIGSFCEEAAPRGGAGIRIGAGRRRDAGSNICTGLCTASPQKIARPPARSSRSPICPTV